jgi:hypothetical protein
MEPVAGSNLNEKRRRKNEDNAEQVAEQVAEQKNK